MAGPIDSLCKSVNLDDCTVETPTIQSLDMELVGQKNCALIGSRAWYAVAEYNGRNFLDCDANCGQLLHNCTKPSLICF